MSASWHHRYTARNSHITSCVRGHPEYNNPLSAKEVYRYLKSAANKRLRVDESKAKTGLKCHVCLTAPFLKLKIQAIPISVQIKLIIKLSYIYGAMVELVECQLSTSLPWIRIPAQHVCVCLCGGLRLKAYHLLTVLIMNDSQSHWKSKLERMSYTPQSSGEYIYRINSSTSLNSYHVTHSLKPQHHHKIYNFGRKSLSL